MEATSFSSATAPMEPRMLGFCSVLGILFLSFTYCFSRTEVAFDLESFERKLIALRKVLDYVRDKSQQMDIDATFGITLTEANLAAALLHENARHLENRSFNALKEIVVLCNLTRRKLMHTVVPRDETELLLQSVLNDPNLWMKSISWRRLYPRARFDSSRLLNYSSVIESIWHGVLNETKSDWCLSKIAYSSLKGRCRIPDDCMEILIRNDNPTGYSLTHRLLIVQIARALGCRETKPALFSYLISVYCVKILRDLVNLEIWNFPNVGPDLMTEQIILCGMEGYSEFVDKHYEDLILSWPHQSGCFRAYGFNKKRRITRRSSTMIGFGCDSHATALAAASLAVFIRENVENALVKL